MIIVSDITVTIVNCDYCNAHYELLGKNGTTMPYIKYCPSCGNRSVDATTEYVD